MRKFTDLNKENLTVESSTNKKDFVTNLIEESLSVKDGEIIGKEVLSKAINRIMELNDSKTIIKVLESVKMRSFHTLNLEWINEAIVFEKKKMDEDCEDEECEECEDEECEDCEDDDLNESADEDKYLTAKQKKLPEGLKKGIIKKMKKSGKTLDNKDDDKDDDKDKKDDKEDKKKDSKKDDKSLSDEEKYLTPKQRKLPEGLKKGIIARAKKKSVKESLLTENCEIEVEVTIKKDDKKVTNVDDFEEDELIADEFIDPIDVEEDEEMFIEESMNYMQDVHDLRKIMESIKNGVNESHLTDRDDQLNYILSRFTDKKVEKVVLDVISDLPTYVKNADIQRTLENLSDKEIEDLYLKIEKVN